jgi:hypothetical protein
LAGLLHRTLLSVVGLCLAQGRERGIIKIEVAYPRKVPRGERRVDA